MTGQVSQPILASIKAVVSTNVAFLVLSLVTNTRRLSQIISTLSIVLGLSLVLTSSRSTNPKALILYFEIVVWAIRLSVHALLKIYNEKRLKKPTSESKESKKSFVLFWMVQIFWGIILTLPACIAISTQNYTHSGPDYYDLISLAIWCLGLFMESYSDSRKLEMMSRAGARKDYSSENLRSLSFAGEILVWLGICSSTYLLMHNNYDSANKEMNQRDILMSFSPVLLIALMLLLIRTINAELKKLQKNKKPLKTGKKSASTTALHKNQRNTVHKNKKALSTNSPQNRTVKKRTAQKNLHVTEQPSHTKNQKSHTGHKHQANESTKGSTSLRRSPRR